MDRRLLVLTGAGASRSLGAEHDLPLMLEWSGILADALDAVLDGLSKALGLRNEISSEDFERIVGELLELQTALPLLQSYTNAGVVGTPGTVRGQARQFVNRLDERLSMFERALRETLYDQFGLPAISRDAARTAMRRLMEAIEGEEGVILATTNYDRALEIGLAANGSAFRDGSESGTGLETPRLSPEGLANWSSEQDTTVSVIHLHGAVGWYLSADGSISCQPADQPFNPTLGTPAILPPDPSKDPMTRGMLRTIWGEFRRALEEATHVLVLGHSLHDAHLVEAFREAAPTASFAVSFFDQPHDIVDDGVTVPTGTDGLKALALTSDARGFDRAVQFHLDLSPRADLSLVEAWLTGG